MPTHEQMKAAQAEGMSFICATCHRYWEGRAARADRCTAKGPCRGPMGGGSFPEYDGPVTDLRRWCFRCGVEASSGVRVAGTERIFGVCDRHLPDVSRLAPVQGGPGHLLEILRPALVEVKDLIRRPRPHTRRSAADLIAEAVVEIGERAGGSRR